MVSKTKNKGSDKILTVVFVVAIIIGFYLVSMVNASFENDEGNVTLFKTDSATNFPTYPKVDWSFPSTPNQTTSLNTFASPLAQYEKSPVYLGNDTWGMSINETFAGQLGTAIYIIELPNLENWIIDEIIINQTKNIETIIDSTIKVYSLPIAEFTQSSLATTLFDGSVGSVSLFANKTIDLTLAQALDINDKAEGKTIHFIAITMVDTPDNGLEPWAWNIEMEITGHQMDTYNIVQQLEFAVGISIILNVCVIVFMTDEIDIGGFVNDIPNKKKRS